MKTTIYTILIIFATASLIFATSDIIKSFTAYSNSTAIILEWETISEHNIKSFTPERSRNDGVFSRVDDVDAVGKPNNYTYTDQSVFMKDTENNNTVLASEYKYRLKINYEDGSHTYTNIISVPHSVSSVRRTWGMIKEMFR